jgi:hypothetical protein
MSPATSNRRRGTRRARSESPATGKVPRTYRLAPEKVANAQRILGARTATETIETALDMVVFRRDLVRGTAAMLGVHIDPPDPTD